MRLLLLFALLLAGCTTTPEAPVLSPEDELATFEVADGYRVELVAAEPLVEAPVAMAFDEDERLWVVEMRGFMPDVDGTGEDDPTGRIAVLTDTNGDGQMDERVTFLDSLVLPRSLAVTRGGVLVADYERLYFARDLDGDGRADEQRVVDSAFAPGGNPEHDPNGLYRALDNWFYNAKSSTRYRWDGDQLIRDETEFRGQWGLSQDDFGRLFYNYNFSQLHTDLAPPNYLSRNPHHTPTSGISVDLASTQRIFPIRSTPAVNRGYIPGALDEQGRLQEFTAACSPLVYRGNALPEGTRGDAFVCEPAANLVKRSTITGTGLDLAAKSVYADHDFLASTDERFRPVALADGPDGALYIADMYRGLIQHGVALTPYLREQTLQRGLDQPLHQGRIWRVVADEPANGQQAERLSTATPDQLVAALADPNGWRRDVAQRLLVERNAKDIEPALLETAVEHESPLARLHAIWTLEGLGLSQPEALFPALDDPHPQVRAAALRVLESCAEPARLAATLRQTRIGESSVFDLQVALTLGNLSGRGRLEKLEEILSQHVARPLFRDAVLSSLQEAEHLVFLERLWSNDDWSTEDLNRAVFLEALATAIIQRRDSDEVQHMLGLIRPEGERLAWRERALLSGATVFASQRSFEPIALSEPPASVKHLEALKPMLSWPGHTPAPRRVADVEPLTPEEEELFVRGRQVHLAVCAGCHGKEGEGLKPLAPPLADSEWVVGPKSRLIRLMLHGLSGPIHVAGVRYAPPDALPEMPPMRTLDNESLAAVLTYMRRAWDHTASPISSHEVGQLRYFTQGRTTPWTEAELLEIEDEEE